MTPMQTLHYKVGDELRETHLLRRFAIIHESNLLIFRISDTVFLKWRMNQADLMDKILFPDNLASNRRLFLRHSTFRNLHSDQRVTLIIDLYYKTYYIINN